jgi:3-dehydroquinate dehydratase-2
VSGLPTIEVHLSAIEDREDWRARSVIRDLCVGVVSGRGPDGYRDALELLQNELAS